MACADLCKVYTTRGILYAGIKEAQSWTLPLESKVVLHHSVYRNETGVKMNKEIYKKFFFFALQQIKYIGLTCQK